MPNKQFRYGQRKSTRSFGSKATHPICSQRRTTACRHDRWHPCAWL